SCVSRLRGTTVLLAQQRYPAAIFLFDDLASGVLRSIVDNDDLCRRVRLIQNAVNRTADKSLAVIDRNNRCNSSLDWHSSILPILLHREFAALQWKHSKRPSAQRLSGGMLFRNCCAIHPGS